MARFIPKQRVQRGFILANAVNGSFDVPRRGKPGVG